MIHLRMFIILAVTLIACNSSKKTVQNNLPKVEAAVWYNWSGGQPGVGGTNYDITINSDSGSLEISALEIDGQNLPANLKEKENGLYMVSASENRSMLDESVSRMDRRPNFRSTSPESCKLTLLVNNVPVTLVISNWEKDKTKNYP